jgi:uncharacterized membrane protein YjjP (DUF1212 family)
MIPAPERDHAAPPSSALLTEMLEALLRFGTQLLRAGDNACQVRRLMGMVARRMGFDALSMQLGLGSITASGRRRSEGATLVREVGASGVNSWRIGALEELASTAPPGMTPHELATKLAAIEGAPPRYSVAQTGAAIGGSCAAFAFLNGCTGLEVAAAAVGGVIGQGLRSWLSRQRFNQYIIAALSALVASSVYCLGTAVLRHAGFGIARYDVGLISSVLFLVPGFPLVTSLFDMLQHETAVALARLANATMLLLNAALGVYVVIAVVGVSFDSAAPPALAAPLLLMLRALASFVGACGFAILYNSPCRTVLHVGLLTLIGNPLRLALRDAGLALASATFVGALVVGLLESLARARGWMTEPRMEVTVPGVIMMVPGLYAFEALTLFNQGEVLAALRSLVLVVFVVGAMAMGLVVARLISRPEWLRE